MVAIASLIITAYTVAISAGGLEGWKPFNILYFPLAAAAAPPQPAGKEISWGGNASPNPTTA
jgi:hypothetical protein